MQLPKIIALLPKLVKPIGGKLGIVVMLGAIAASAAIKKIKEQKAAAVQALKDEVGPRISELEGRLATAAEEDIEKLQDELATVQSIDLEDIPLSVEEVETMVDAKIEEVEPQIVTALAPFTALLGFPVFVVNLMGRLSKFADIGEEVTAYIANMPGTTESGPGLVQHLNHSDNASLQAQQDNTDGSTAFVESESTTDDDDTTTTTTTTTTDDDDTTTTTTTTTTTSSDDGAPPSGGGGGGGGGGGDGGGDDSGSIDEFVFE
jgi:Tfp pilus assembly major pilin PilA